jgi:catechol 2,3-dioxygenase-like lactoylglutathione lyase family enzyme
MNNKPVVDKFRMITMIVSDMPKAKDFYGDKLGLKIMNDYRQDEDRWWVSLALPEGGVTITLTTYRQNFSPGTTALYFSTSDLAAAHENLLNKGVETGGIRDDLHGPGSGVKFFNFKDPEGNLIHIEQA